MLSQSRKNLYTVYAASKDLPRGLAWGVQRGFPLFFVLAKVYKFSTNWWFGLGSDRKGRKVFRKV